MKPILYLMFSMFCIFSAHALAESFYKADFINPSDAEKKWGTLKLNAKVFKSGDLAKRAPMAVDIVMRQLYVGKSRKTVRSELGDPDSYFFSDTIYAYKIMPYPGQGKEIWHVVFIPDEKLRNVKEVKIHKKCCYQQTQ